MSVSDNGSGIDNPIPYRVHDTDGICPTISATGGGGTEPHIAEPCFIDLNYGAGIHETDVSRCLSARDYKGISLKNAAMSGVMHTVKEDERVVIPVLTPDRIHKRQNGRRFKEDGEPMFTLTAQDQHGVGVELDINEEFFDTLKPGTAFSDADENAIGAVPDEKAAHDGLYVQLSEDLIVYAIWYEKYQCYITIRRLTPKECFRLQGWTDDYFEKAAFVNSDSQLYKQAGNGVTVLVVEAVANRIKEAIKKMKLHNQLDDELEQLWQEFNKKKDTDDVPKSGTS